MPLVILDRDGVINEESEEYIRSLDDWRPIPGSLEAIAALAGAGYTIAVATNQSGLARGYFGLDDLETIHAHLCQRVEDLGGSISGIFYCPHLPEEGCRCRKPGTGLLEAIADEFGETPRGSVFIGDSLKDLQCARAYGCLPVLVRTGKGEATLTAIRAGETDLPDPGTVPVYADLAAAASAILHGRHASKDDR